MLRSNLSKFINDANNGRERSTADNKTFDTEMNGYIIDNKNMERKPFRTDNLLI